MITSNALIRLVQLYLNKKMKEAYTLSHFFVLFIVAQI